MSYLEGKSYFLIFIVRSVLIFLQTTYKEAYSVITFTVEGLENTGIRKVAFVWRM